MTHDLRCARLTARGEAGVAVFRLSGLRAREVLARLFRPRGAAPLAPGQLRVGRLIDGAEVLDDAVVRVGGAAAGFEAEISIHGGIWVADRLGSLLAAAGAEPLEEHELQPAPRDLGVGRLDPTAGEAREDLLAAFADAQVLFFLDALGGGLSRETASIERSLAAAHGADALEAVVDRLDALLLRAPLGLAMARPPSVLLAGAPNSGKSTLFNALVGEARAIVSPEPGTTRDVVDEAASIAGFPFRILDSAGIRGAADAVERLGVARAEAARAAADIVVVLIDPTADVYAQAAFAESVRPRARRVVALSKSDLAAAPPASAARLAALGVTAVSAHSGIGLDGLRDRIVAASPFGGVASLRQAAPFRPRHVEMLARLRARALGASA